MRPKNFLLGLIENSGPDNLRDTLKAKLEKASEVRIAVAFLTQLGLSEIVQALRQVAVEGNVKLITGLYQFFTEPQALKSLLTIQNQTNGQLSVRLSKEPQFHRKVYLIKSATRSTAIIGSSNLTKDGLQSAGELNVILNLPNNTAHLKKFINSFETQWNSRAVPLTEERIERYTQARPKPEKSLSLSRSKLKDILGTEFSRKKTGSTSPIPSVFWRDCVVGFAAARTEKIISQTTNWDKRNYLWYSAGSRHSYRIGDQILLFDKTDKTLCLVKVRDVAQTNMPTPDGRHFVAYSRIKGFRKRLTESLWENLNNEKITRQNMTDHVKLTKEKAEKIMKLIKVSRA